MQMSRCDIKSYRIIGKHIPPGRFASLTLHRSTKIHIILLKPGGSVRWTRGEYICTRNDCADRGAAAELVDQVKNTNQECVLATGMEYPNMQLQVFGVFLTSTPMEIAD
jgi:hypothetical protein